MILNLMDVRDVIENNYTIPKEKLLVSSQNLGVALYMRF